MIKNWVHEEGRFPIDNKAISVQSLNSESPLSDDVENSLQKAFLRAIRECQVIGYNPARFLQMLGEHGPVATGIQLVMAKDYHEGFAKLWELGRLDLSVEAIILRKPYRTVFPPEVLERAEQKLREVGFIE